MLLHLIGLIGVAGGIAALVSNVRAIGIAPTPQDSRRRRVFAICASAVGLALCPLTLLIGIEHHINLHGQVIHYGWPFGVITNDMYAAEGPILDEVGLQIAFWILAPPALLCVAERLFKAARRM